MCGFSADKRIAFLHFWNNYIIYFIRKIASVFLNAHPQEVLSSLLHPFPYFPKALTKKLNSLSIVSLPCR